MMHLSIVFEDEQLVVIDKPNGLLVHRSKIARDAKEFALQILRDQLGQYVYPIHRLDRKTSGLLLFTKKKENLNLYKQRLSHPKTNKEYVALVRGYFPDEMTLNHPLLDEKGKLKEAVTHFKCIERYEIPFQTGKHGTSRYSLINALPETGRMHQIRRHLNHLRHPIIGDRPHGCNKQNRFFLAQWGLKNMLLHAEKLALYNPKQNSYQNFSTTKPPEFIRILNHLSDFSRF
jgi:tRNA pseudouridine65 synthase